MRELNIMKLWVIKKPNPHRHNTFKKVHLEVGQEKCALNLIHCCVKTGIAHKAIIANWNENSLDILFIKKRVKLTFHATITINENPFASSFLGGSDLGLQAGHNFLSGYAMLPAGK